MEKPTYNQKGFLLPISPRSMAAYHAKVQEDGIYKLTIHDCEGSIQLWGDLNDPEQLKEAEIKLMRLIQGIHQLKEFIIQEYSPSKIDNDVRRI